MHFISLPGVDVEGWDDSDWGWKVESDVAEEENTNESHSWLQDCHLSVSPVAELMALANKDKLVLLGRMYFFVFVNVLK